jgi:hypothetical protein
MPEVKSKRDIAPLQRSDTGRTDARRNGTKIINVYWGKLQNIRCVSEMPSLKQPEGPDYLFMNSQ